MHQQKGDRGGMKMQRILLVAFTMVALSVCLSMVAHASLVENGSFEAGNFVPDINNVMSLTAGSTAIAGWSVVNGETGWVNTPNPWGAMAADGDYFVNLAGYDHSPPYGGVSQAFATNDTQKYSLSFDLGSGGGVNWGPSTILVNVDNTPFYFTTDWSSEYHWSSFNLNFIAESTSTPISFIGASGAHNVSIDNVSITPVPLPATILLFGTGVACLAGTKKIRNFK
jgi:hypothetical protein